VAIRPGWRSSKWKRHVVTRIIAPGSGVPIEDRPPVPTEDERCAVRDAKYAAKQARRAVRDLGLQIESRLSMSEKIIRMARQDSKIRAKLEESRPEEGKAEGEAQQ